ncbi:hypothetical protein [Cytobacillus solani]|uniref:Uncharacterized protein n=1 Tax=Cytobacillus solani TaxID=1637975 RepID=A0A0Q3QQP8_9BACI|nr:hypothetical protein [Cytobacillus solani]KOP81980.1 hypothetical protein AMS60_05475 [Bacillus sp. FJAT-21945]KQL20489.1 hypothetical protein AN957_19135 [Cytobacillus solani]
MAGHVRGDNYKPTTTIAFDPNVLKKVDDYWYENRKGNRSKGVNELIQYGLKYLELVEKKKQREAERMLG